MEPNVLWLTETVILDSSAWSAEEVLAPMDSGEPYKVELYHPLPTGHRSPILNGIDDRIRAPILVRNYNKLVDRAETIS